MTSEEIRRWINGETELQLMPLWEIAYQLAVMNEREGRAEWLKSWNTRGGDDGLADAQPGKRDADPERGTYRPMSSFLHRFMCSKDGIRCVNCGKFQSDCVPLEVCVPPIPEPGKRDADRERGTASEFERYVEEYFPHAYKVTIENLAAYRKAASADPQPGKRANPERGTCGDCRFWDGARIGDYRKCRAFNYQIQTCDTFFCGHFSLKPTIAASTERSEQPQGAQGSEPKPETGSQTKGHCELCGGWINHSTWCARFVDGEG